MASKSLCGKYLVSFGRKGGKLVLNVTFNKGGKYAAVPLVNQLAELGFGFHDLARFSAIMEEVIRRDENLMSFAQRESAERVVSATWKEWVKGVDIPCSTLYPVMVLSVQDEDMFRVVCENLWGTDIDKVFDRTWFRRTSDFYSVLAESGIIGYPVIEKHAGNRSSISMGQVTLARNGGDVAMMFHDGKAISALMQRELVQVGIGLYIRSSAHNELFVFIPHCRNEIDVACEKLKAKAIGVFGREIVNGQTYLHVVKPKSRR